MFTGIVSDIGTVVERKGGRFAIACGYKHKSLEEGASLACDGCCLTLIDVEKAKKGAVVAVEASNETLARTTLFSWREGRRINLERPLTLGDELGGHIVTGHVDAAAMILEPHARRRQRAVRAGERRPALPASSPRKARSRSTASRSPLTRSTARASV